MVAVCRSLAQVAIAFSACVVLADKSWLDKNQVALPTSTCSMGPLNHCPISGMTQGEYTAVYPGGRTRCLSKSAPHFAFNVIPGDPDKLLLYFEGGGLCFNWLSGLLHTCAKKVNDDPVSITAGVFSRHSSNPFSRHTVILLNYCSGDFFLLKNAKHGVGEQRGFYNAQSGVEWAKANMAGHLTSLVLIGESAGGVAIQAWATHLLDTFSFDSASVIIDSLVSGIFPVEAQRVLIENFGLCESGLLGGKVQKRCADQHFLIDDVLLAAVDDYPNVLFAAINSKEDMAQIWMYNFMAPMIHAQPSSIDSTAYFHIVNTYLQKFESKPNYVSYIVASGVHCWTSKDWMATTDITGHLGAGLHGDMTLSNWLSGLAAHSVKSQCSGRALPSEEWPNSVEYCDVSQVNKQSWSVSAVPTSALREGPKVVTPTAPPIRVRNKCKRGWGWGTTWREKCPISLMAAGQATSVYPGRQTRCLSKDSPEYFFDVIPGDSDKLLLYFEGGGLCFNGISGFLHTCTSSAEEDPMDTNAGVFSHAASNPFRKHTIVFLNYCSGDMFVGNDAYGFGEQRGLVNAQAGIDWAKENMDHDLESLVLIGESSGAAAVQLWSRSLLQEFTYARGNVLIDSIVTGVFDGGAQSLLAKSFSICKSGLIHDCDESTFDVNSVFASVVDAYPQVLFGVINSKADAGQIWMYNFVAPMIGANPLSMNRFSYFQSVNMYLRRFDKRPNFVSYLVSSATHCFTSKEWMATTDTTGEKGGGWTGAVTLSAWLASFLSMSVQSQCNGMPSEKWLEFSLDYCDAPQVSKVSGKGIMPRIMGREVNAAAAPTSLSKAVAQGATTLEVAQQFGFTLGQEIVIDAGTAQEELNEIAKFGSIILKDPLKFAHAAGATVTGVGAAVAGSKTNRMPMILLGIGFFLLVASIVAAVAMRFIPGSRSLNIGEYDEDCDASQASDYDTEADFVSRASE